MEAVMKRDKFVELAESRTKKALKQIKLISNLSNLNSYEYSETDVKRIFAALEHELGVAKSKFMKDAGNRTEFTLQ